MNKSKLKQKIVNHIFKEGKKQKSEKILKTSVKLLQKYQKKSHNDIIKLTMLNYIPTFRLIKLKREKAILEVPTFISSLHNRSSWGIKYFIKTVTSDTTKTLSEKLKKTFLSYATKTETLTFKDELQKNALKQKNYFKYYRW